jgi:prepilin-type N-terminal cleavage/methylation domain-containing protein
MCVSKLHSRRRGFTLVELLVVIAIIGVLVALLLPAVQAAREAARRASCVNNIKNLALGLHNYHGAQNAFPDGHYWDKWNAGAWGWGFYLLPYIEQQALQSQLYQGKSGSNRTMQQLLLDAAGSATDPSILLMQQPLSVFRCPSDITPTLLPAEYRTWDSKAAPAPPEFEPPAANYVASDGYFIGRKCVYPSKVGCDDTGIFYVDSHISMKQISDGTSNTFLVGERDERCDAATWVGVPSAPAWGENEFWIYGTTKWKLNRPVQDRSAGGYRACGLAFSSAHVGGANFAMADASVRFIDEEIDYDVGGVDHGYTPTGDKPWPDNWPNETLGIYQRLGTRDDGLVVPAF